MHIIDDKLAPLSLEDRSEIDNMLRRALDDISHKVRKRQARQDEVRARRFEVCLGDRPRKDASDDR